MTSLPIRDSKFGILRCSKEIRKEIKKRLKELNVSLYQLCEQLDINYKYTRLYLNTSLPLSTNMSMKDWEILLLTESLGIQIKISVTILPKEKAFARQYERQQVIKVSNKAKDEKKPSK